jgi:molybdopterin-guanine dinucleotide biosynthesis protein A
VNSIGVTTEDPAGQLPAPLYGLILAGGKSSRMGADKAALNYHGEAEVARLYKLLDSHCELVFLSTRREQGDQPVFLSYPQIFDAFPFAGPMNGILSAMQAAPLAAWLVVACDLPRLTAKTIAHLIVNRNPDKLATAFIGARDDLPEPLCAIYEPAARRALMNAATGGNHSPRAALIQNAERVELLAPLEPQALDDADTPPDADRVGRENSM